MSRHSPPKQSSAVCLVRIAVAAWRMPAASSSRRPGATAQAASAIDGFGFYRMRDDTRSTVMFFGAVCSSGRAPTGAARERRDATHCGPFG